jgi:hypothetical protein
LLSDTTYYTQQHSSMLSAGIVITRSQELQGKIDQLNWPVSVRPSVQISTARRAELQATGNGDPLRPETHMCFALRDARTRHPRRVSSFFAFRLSARQFFKPWPVQPIDQNSEEAMPWCLPS